MDNFVKTIHLIVAWLDGRKAKILAIAGPIINYLVQVHVLEPSLATLISVILGILCGGALVVQDSQAYKSDPEVQTILGSREIKRRNMKNDVSINVAWIFLGIVALAFYVYFFYSPR